MSAVSRVSAFAKRRKLNDDSTAPTSESDDSSSLSLTKNAKLSKATTRGVNATRTVRQKSLDVAPVHTRVESDADENSFAPLVDAKAVSFIGTREIEAFDDNSCRVRLSRGQKCSIQGIARLWVREGVICIDGAILNESPEAYAVFCSTSGSSTEIVAQSKFAEFQLHSVLACEEFLPSATNVPGKLGNLSRRGATSFQILDRSEEGDRNSLEATSNISGLTQTVSSHIKTVLGQNTANPRIIVCGKRSADTYRASTALVNRLLTSGSDQATPLHAKIAKIVFLDLDYLSPAFSAPGTISLAILQQPIFGPSYTQPFQQDSKLANHVVTTQYVKAIEDSEKSKLNLNIIQPILKNEKRHLNNSHVIIRTGSWFAHLSPSERSRFQKLLQPSLAICIDTNKSSQHLEVAQALSKDPSDSSVLHLPVSPCSTLSSLQEHKLQLQSHFRVCGTMADTPLWYREPLPDVPVARRLVLSTDVAKGELRFIQVRGGMLRPQDIAIAIHQNLVVIVAVQSEGGIRTDADRHEDTQRQWNNTTAQRDTAKPLLEIRRLEEDDILHFIGLAFVEEVDIKGMVVTLNTLVSMNRIQHFKSLGHEIGLVLEKPGIDGRFGRQLLFA